MIEHEVEMIGIHILGLLVLVTCIGFGDHNEILDVLGFHHDCFTQSTYPDAPSRKCVGPGQPVFARDLTSAFIAYGLIATLSTPSERSPKSW